MHKTIWLLALRRQLLAKNSGTLPIGFIDITVPIKNKKTKNIESKIKNASNEPKIADTNGIKKEKETAPAGVIPRCVMFIASCKASAFFASGFILSSFSLKLHRFSYKVMCFGRNSALNS